ncbi:hypothetical protein [Enterobacter hormaechei]|uniref:hypothetical protein n=1 Tax=Enterobacter hormaechei TaxID=158836 RepID=UPI0018C2B440|nr:hypothetical protein [Enterobacter hormaechei]MBG0707546.1 hypothetical protein [Enterobacter hormaechei]
MKITNASARLYYIAGQKLAPGQTAEVEDSWKDNKTVKASITKGELRLADKDEAVTASQVEKKEKDKK